MSPGTTLGTSPGDPPDDPPDNADLAAATESLAAALEAQGVLSREQAECAAAGWIEGAGLEEMAAAGFFDEDWTYVDQDRSEMTPEMDAAATAAVLRCAAQ